MSILYDIHSHQSHPLHKSIVSVSPHLYNPQQGVYYSIGIHPWESEKTHCNDIKLIEEHMQHPQVVAVGETGVDRLKGACLEKQITLLQQHIKISEQYRKPLILHVVRSVDVILALHRKYNPSQQWIIHGYRGNRTTALQLLNKNINLSFNNTFNKESVKITPLEKLWIESDENTHCLEQTYQEIAAIKNINAEELIKSVATRAEKLFFQP